VKLWIGGELETAVGDEWRHARSAVESAVNVLISDIDALEANQWDVTAILRDDDVFSERVRFSKKNGMDIRLRITYEKFLVATPKVRHELIIDMLIRSLEIIQKKYPTIDAISKVKELMSWLKNET